MKDLLIQNFDGSHPALFKVDVTTIVAFLSLNLETSRLEANWLLIDLIFGVVALSKIVVELLNQL